MVKKALLIIPFVVCVFGTLYGMVIWQGIAMKARGSASECPWTEILTFPVHFYSARQIEIADHTDLRKIQEDRANRLVLLESPKGRFWIPQDGHQMNGEQLLAYLIADHEVTARRARKETVQTGDVVVDCGAHVGVFTRKALNLGARLVVAVEIDPANVECLRRNFSDEIRLGRVIVYPKGVWDHPGELVLQAASHNSGMHSVAVRRDAAEIRAEVTTIDRIVHELKLERVDLIKMDIEGAERNALRGAAQLLAKQKPRLMLDSNHRPDDMSAFRAQLLPIGYRPKVVGCRGCDQQSDLVMPSVTFWTAR